MGAFVFYWMVYKRIKVWASGMAYAVKNFVEYPPPPHAPFPVFRHFVLIKGLPLSRSKAMRIALTLKCAFLKRSKGRKEGLFVWKRYVRFQSIRIRVDGALTKTTQLQPWTKVPGTVLQYRYFSVISRFPHKTVHPFRTFLAFLPPPLYTKLKLGIEFWILASNIVCGMMGWTCVNWKAP